MNTISCPHCGQPVEISTVLHDQMLQQINAEEKEKQIQEIEKVRKEEQEKAAKKAREEFEMRFKDIAEEAKEEKERREKLMQDLLKANEVVRELQRKDEERELANQKKMQEEREKLKDEISKIESEKSQLKLAELQKQLDDTKKSLEEAQRKSSQTSQQLQGEVLELKLEESLSSAFAEDSIEPVQKGIKGADIKHIVKTKLGNTCGIILWESKRTKSWSEDYVTKLREDLRTEKAHMGIIVSEVLPKDVSAGFGHRGDILICSISLAISIAELVRQQLIAVAREKYLSEHKNTANNAQRVMEYITSHEFIQQLQAFAELHQEMYTQIAKERAAFEKHWKAREVHVEKMLKSTSAIAGSLQGILGTSMPQIKGLDLLEE